MVEVVGRYSKLPNLAKLGGFTPGNRLPVAPDRIHAAPKRLGPEAIAQLVADYKAGSPSTELMAKYSIGKGTVLKLLRDNGVQLRNQGLSAEQLAEATELYASGQSLATIGKQMGLHHSSVHWALRGTGVVMRSAHQRRNRSEG